MGYIYSIHSLILLPGSGEGVIFFVGGYLLLSNRVGGGWNCFWNYFIPMLLFDLIKFIYIVTTDWYERAATVKTAERISAGCCRLKFLDRLFYKCSFLQILFTNKQCCRQFCIGSRIRFSKFRIRILLESGLIS